MKTLFTVLALLALSIPSTAFSDTRAGTLGTQFTLDNSATAGPASQLGTKLVRERLYSLTLVYDITVSGGGTGTRNLLGLDGKPAKLPQGAIVRDCIIDVITPGTTSASGTMDLGTGQGTADLKSALAAASYTGRVACVPVGTAATAIKLTADRTPTFTITTGAFTNGKWYVILTYELSNST